jgi:predicted ATP-dependent endonuclease of OLD family
MMIEVLDFHYRWAEEEEDRPLLHLVIIEEPEVHLHAQPQQVFINKIMAIIEGLSQKEPLFTSQMIVTTHSPHIIYESSFTPIRYFRRISNADVGNYSEVLNLSNFHETEKNTRDFLLQYMKLTHCDLFFADAAILVEGNVERLLLPLMIEKAAPQLKSCYLSILELGGAFAHLFKNLIHFLGLTTLVITDLDSVHPTPAKSLKSEEDEFVDPADFLEEDDEDDLMEAVGSGVCMVHTQNAVTSNQTLIQWLPKLTNISELLDAMADLKTIAPTEANPAKVCVAFQTRQFVTWHEEKMEMAGRTFEEAFAYENLAWCQDIKQKSLKLRVVRKKLSPPLAEVAQKIHDKVRGNNFNKTDFALALMMVELSEWKVPTYIAEGLQWLSEQLKVTDAFESLAGVASTKVEETS